MQSFESRDGKYRGHGSGVNYEDRPRRKEDLRESPAGSVPEGYVSPLSLEQGYKLFTIPRTLREPNWLTREEAEAISLIKTFGAGASFQLQHLWENPDKGRKKLKKLADMGVIIRHKLVGRECTLNVYSLSVKEEVESLLKRITLLQLALVSQSPVLPAQSPADAFWHYNDRELYVLTVRSNPEKIKYLPLRHLGRVVIISPKPLDFSLPVPARLLLDRELIDWKLVFRYPSGSRES